MFDPKCQDLAEEFLSDEPYVSETSVRHERHVKDLAQTIQDAIEGWFDDRAREADEMRDYHPSDTWAEHRGEQ